VINLPPNSVDRACLRRVPITGGVHRSLARVEPVSVSTGNSCRENVCRSQRPGRHFRRHQSIPQRRTYLKSLAAKLRKANDYSDRARKPELRGTAWWSWRDSNWQPSDYGPQGNHQRLLSDAWSTIGINDQKQAGDDFNRKKFAAARVPIKLNSNHPNPQYRNKRFSGH
jgi:hypothetical protein